MSGFGGAGNIPGGTIIVSGGPNATLGVASGGRGTVGFWPDPSTNFRSTAVIVNKLQKQ